MTFTSSEEDIQYILIVIEMNCIFIYSVNDLCLSCYIEVNFFETYNLFAG